MGWSTKTWTDCRSATYRAYTVSKGRSWDRLSAILGLGAGTDCLLYWGCRSATYRACWEGYRLATYRAYTVSKGELGPIVCYIGAAGRQPTGLAGRAIGWQPTGLTQCQRPIACHIGAVGRQPTGLAGTDCLLYWGYRLASYRAYTVSKGRSWDQLSAILGL